MKRVDGPARARALLHLSCVRVCMCARFCCEESEERNVSSGSIDVYFTFFHAVRFFLEACGSPIREIWRSA